MAYNINLENIRMAEIRSPRSIVRCELVDEAACMAQACVAVYPAMKSQFAEIPVYAASARRYPRYHPSTVRSS